MRYWGKSAEGEGEQAIAAPQAPAPPFVAIIGVHSSGSSMLAWVLSKLGVHMGNQLNGNAEAQGLAHLCEKAYPFGQTKPQTPAPLTQAALSEHVRARTEEARNRGVLVGGKYPHLCAMRDMLRVATPNGLKIIHTDRPLDDSIASLVSRCRKDRAAGNKWLGISDESAEQVQRWLHEQKKSYFDGTILEADILHMDYYTTLKNPRAELDRIVKFLGLSPTPAQYGAALATIQPEKRKHGNPDAAVAQQAG